MLLTIPVNSVLLTFTLAFLFSKKSSEAFIAFETSLSHTPQFPRLQSKRTLQKHQSSRGQTMSYEDAGDEGQSVGQMYGGLVFLKTQDRAATVEFYKSRIGMVDWLEQPNITILRHGNMILGFHQPKEDQPPDLSGMYTFVYPSRQQVDEMHSKLKDIADAPPRVNDIYKIYQFFAKDPEGRNLEFQAFLHPLSVATSQP